MLMIIYTQQQLEVVNDIKNNENVLLSSAHGTGKSMVFLNQSIYPNDLYFSIGRSDLNLTDLCRQYHHEDLSKSFKQRLFLDNVLIDDVNQFKHNYKNLASRLKNIHIIAYFKNPHNLNRYFPKSTTFTKYYGQPTQRYLSNKKKGDYSCLSNLITEYEKTTSEPVYRLHEAEYTLDKYDKVIDNTANYNYTIEGKFPKQYYHGPRQLLYYTPVLVIKVDDFDEEIDERMLKAMDRLIILKRQPTTPPQAVTPQQHTTKTTQTQTEH